jgi:hypothetical protein
MRDCGGVTKMSGEGVGVRLRVPDSLCIALRWDGIGRCSKGNGKG